MLDMVCMDVLFGVPEDIKSNKSLNIRVAAPDAGTNFNILCDLAYLSYFFVYFSQLVSSHSMTPSFVVAGFTIFTYGNPDLNFSIWLFTSSKSKP